LTVLERLYLVVEGLLCFELQQYKVMFDIEDAEYEVTARIYST